MRYENKLKMLIKSVATRIETYNLNADVIASQRIRLLTAIFYHIAAIKLIFSTEQKTTVLNRYTLI